MPKKIKEEKTDERKVSLSASLAKLHAIVDWFENNENIDLEEGMKKIKEGAEHLKVAREGLKEMDNEFKEVEKVLND